MFQDLSIIDALEGARNCAIELANVTRADDVLILTDSMSDFRISQALACVCHTAGADVTILVIRTRNERTEEPPKMVAEAIKSADVLFTPLYTPTYQFHWNAIKTAGTGVRWIPMIGHSIETLTSRGASFPAEVVFEIAKRVMKQWQNGKEIRVTCDRGSNLKAEITKSEHVSGGPIRPMQRGDYIGAFAGGYGVIHLWPDWTTEGVVFFDAIDGFEGKLNTPIKYTVRKGRVVRFEGAEEQVEFLENVTTCENGDHFAEFGLGINPASSVKYDAPVRWEAERHAGCLHCGIGKASLVPCQIHIDAFIPKPTILIDDEICVEKGKLKVLEDPGIQALARRYGLQF